MVIVGCPSWLFTARLAGQERLCDGKMLCEGLMSNHLHFLVMTAYCALDNGVPKKVSIGLMRRAPQGLQHNGQ